MNTVRVTKERKSIQNQTEKNTSYVYLYLFRNFVSFCLFTFPFSWLDAHETDFTRLASDLTEHPILFDLLDTAGDEEYKVLQEQVCALRLRLLLLFFLLVFVFIR